MELIGVLIVVLGFIFKVETLFVVLLAGMVTGLVGGMDVETILSTLGEAFVANRTVSLFILTIPVIGVLERYGIKERSIYLIQKLGKLTAGKVLAAYGLGRIVVSALSIRIQGHAQFVRPLVNPMAEAAGNNTHKQLDETDLEAIKGYSAAAENYGNFFGQNLFPGSSGVLLITSTLVGFGYAVTELDVAKASIFIALACAIIFFTQMVLFDKKLTSKYKNKK